MNSLGRVTSSLIFLTIAIMLDLKCIWRYITGIPCPGCGLTRSFLFLLQGNFEKALFYHALSVPIMVLLIYYLLEDYFSFNIKVNKNVICFTAGILVLVYYLFRIYNKTIFLI